MEGRREGGRLQRLEQVFPGRFSQIPNKQRNDEARGRGVERERGREEGRKERSTSSM